MTEILDLRANAFVSAWERVETAQKLKVDPHGRLVEPLPESYWALMAEAAILADLARAGADTGIAAGTHLLRRKECDARIRDQVMAAAERRRPKPDLPVEIGHRVRVTRADYAGRIGEVSEVFATSIPLQVGIILDPLTDEHVGGEAITARLADVEFVG